MDGSAKLGEQQVCFLAKLRASRLPGQRTQSKKEQTGKMVAAEESPLLYRSLVMLLRLSSRPQLL